MNNIKEKKISTKQLVYFYLILVAAFLLLSTKALLKGELNTWFYLFAAWTVAYPLLFLIKREFAEKVFFAWLALGIILGKMNLTIILGFVFYFLITPIALILRLKKTPLLFQASESKDSYFIPIDERSNWNQNYEQQS